MINSEVVERIFIKKGIVKKNKNRKTHTAKKSALINVSCFFYILEGKMNFYVCLECEHEWESLTEENKCSVCGAGNIVDEEDLQEEKK